MNVDEILKPCGKPSIEAKPIETMDLSELKKKEEQKRDVAYDPAQRWQHIQQTISWAEANLPPHLRRNRPRTATTARQALLPEE